MSEPLSLALLILLLPLAAALVSWMMAAYASTKQYAHFPLITACGTATVLSAILFQRMLAGTEAQYISEPVTWYEAGRFIVNYTIAVDALSTIMLGMITFIATMIAVFSAAYMRGDSGYPRYFAIMGLFVFSMCGLVLANNLLLLVAFWEGVGLCSYLLVGYYYTRPTAAAAARKAFLVTRLGDTGLLLGIFLLWQMGGWHTDLDMLFEHIRKVPPDPAMMTTACLLLFCGAIGKSAQFPLYVWLPDAMEGPTPVSALIHAATMVTAGVYLLARCAPLFVLSPEAQFTVAAIGGITAILAGFIALAQTDLKRILAYSTVSQLGFMFLALGTAGAISPVLAAGAAMFHLFTHAFFKALLFLSAGSVMHAMGGIIDVRYFGGLRKRMPITHITFLCGAAALAGIPLFSGFWSKDLILEAVADAGESSSRFAAGYSILLVVAGMAALMTAFYTFRAYFLTFWGAERIPPEAGDHAHESPSSMTLPLIVLAIGAVLVGMLVEPFTHWFTDFLYTTPALSQAAAAAGIEAKPHHFNWTFAGVSTLLALIGVGLAYALYRNGGAERAPAGMEKVFALSRNKLFVDELYYFVFVKPAEVLAVSACLLDGFLDGLARLVAAIPRFLAGSLRPMQNGLVQFYALAMALGITVLLLFVIFRITR